MAVFGVAFTSLFRIVADLFMFAGMVMLRFLVMFFPAVAVLGVMAPMSAIVHRVANMAGASVVNVIAFAAGAAVHTTVVSALLSRAQQGGMNLLVLVLCLVSTLVAFVLLFPLLSLTNIVGLSAGGRGVHALRRAGRLASRYATTKKAVENGERDADLVGSSGSGEQLVGGADPNGPDSGTNGTTAPSQDQPARRELRKARTMVGATKRSGRGRNIHRARTSPRRRTFSRAFGWRISPTSLIDEQRHDPQSRADRGRCGPSPAEPYAGGHRRSRLRNHHCLGRRRPPAV